MTDARALWGTDQPPPPRRTLRAGPLEAVLEGAALRWIGRDGVEALRGVAFVVRDRDWGTLDPALTIETLDEGADRFALVMRAVYLSGGARLTATLTVEGRPDGLRYAAEAVADAPFETNRAGFNVLHPADVAGLPAEIEHGDGRVERTRFPELIDPWRPFTDIRAIVAAQGGVVASCRMEGDVFEMEDQRNWTDASFKTYCRPLEEPWPYRIEPGAWLAQSITLTLRPAAVLAAPKAPAAPDARFPQIALAVAPAEVDAALAGRALLAEAAPQRLLLTYDPTAGDGPASFAAWEKLAEAFPAMALDLECVVASLDAFEAEIAAVAEAARRLPLASVLLCPAADRRSTPPGGTWPPCPPLEALYDAGRRAFGDLPLGGGMVSYFTELNRKRPPTGLIDFVGWSTAPIVHAADDASVMETLEALPAVLATAGEIAGGLPRRIGPSTIAMRMNPYGARTMENPEGARKCMAERDPRQRAAFGAAWAAGYAAAIAASGVAVWCPGPFAGPRGLVEDGGRPHPAFDAVRALARLAGARVREAQVAPRHGARLMTDAGGLVANLGPEPATIELDGPHRLGPYEVKTVPRRLR